MPGATLVMILVMVAKLGLQLQISEHWQDPLLIMKA